MRSINIPQTIEAKTKQELIKKMTRVNIAYGGKVHYFDFTFANNKWHCWYEIPQNERPIVDVDKP